jgi:hypothetical protein
MIGVSDVLAVLDRIPAWKALIALPKRVADLESRLAAIEGKGAARVGPRADECPSILSSALPASRCTTCTATGAGRSSSVSGIRRGATKSLRRELRAATQLSDKDGDRDMSEKNEKTDPGTFNFEDALEKVHAHVRSAETYLEVPSGSIRSILTDSDFVAVIKSYAVVEPILNDMLFGHVFQQSTDSSDDSLKAFVTALPNTGRTGKLTLLKRLGHLSIEYCNFIEALTRIRNRYAHNAKNMHRTLTDICKEESKNDAKLLSNLTILVKPNYDVPPELIRLLMYFKLGSFLGEALLHLPSPVPLTSLSAGTASYGT